MKLMAFRTGLIFSTAIACVLILAPTSNGQIDCYVCTVGSDYHPKSRQDRPPPQRLCREFTTSDHFKVHCPNSTYCVTRTFSLELTPGKTVNQTIRECGSEPEVTQIYELNSKLHKWLLKNITEVSETKKGCYSENDQGLRTTQRTICFCEENLCNNAKQTTNISSHTDTIAVIIIYNIMRFLKSHTQPA